MSDVDESAISQRLEDRNATLDTLALIQDLDRRGFDFEPYVLPDTADGGKTIIDTFREHKDELSEQQLRELECRIHDEQNRRQSHGGQSDA